MTDFADINNLNSTPTALITGADKVPFYNTSDDRSYAMSLDQLQAYVLAGGTIDPTFDDVTCDTLVTTGSVGVGVSLLDRPLTVTGSSANTTLIARSFGGGNATSSAAVGRIQFGTTSATTGFVGADITAAAEENWTAGTAQGTRLMFSTTPIGSTTQTTRLTIDSAGNVGIGVTPSAWGSTYSAFQFGTTGSLYGAKSGADFVSLDYNVIVTAANDTYRQTDVATRYRQNSGQHRWFTAPSGTAGNTITFTQAMTLDASGRLGLGANATSPTLRLQIETDANAEEVSWIRNTNTGASSAATIASASAVGSVFLRAHSAAHSVWPNTTLLQSASGFTGGLAIVQAGANPISLWTNNTERARITSGGYLKASNTGTYAGSTGTYHELRSDANNAVLYLSNTNAAYTNDLVFVDTTIAAGTGFDFFDVRANNVGQFRVRGDGTVFAQNTTIQSISDARLKENVVASVDGLDIISALRPVRFDWKAGYGNDRKNQLGFIAQEVEAVFPDAISDWEIDGETYKTVGPAAMIPVLVKAIQQLTTRLEALEA